MKSYCDKKKFNELEKKTPKGEILYWGVDAKTPMLKTVSAISDYLHRSNHYDTLANFLHTNLKPDFKQQIECEINW